MNFKTSLSLTMFKRLILNLSQDQKCQVNKKCNRKWQILISRVLRSHWWPPVSFSTRAGTGSSNRGSASGIGVCPAFTRLQARPCSGSWRKIHPMLHPRQHQSTLLCGPWTLNHAIPTQEANPLSLGGL